ncbi:MAG: hypothetical protein ACRDKI_08910 [Solirubrobacterales bacterium]
MSNTEAEIRAKFHELRPLSFVHQDGFTCFRQMTIESSGLDPEAAENWVMENGGHLKHVRVPQPPEPGQHIPVPDSEPCYFVPNALLDPELN